MNGQFLVAVIAAIGGLSGLVAVVFTRAKLAAEKDATLVSAAQEVLSMALRQLNVLETELQRLTKQVEDYRAQLTAAIAHVAVKEQQVATMATHIETLERLLREHGIPIPATGET